MRNGFWWLAKRVAYLGALFVAVLMVAVIFRDDSRSRSERQLNIQPDDQDNDLPYILLPGDMVKFPHARADVPSTDTINSDDGGDAADCDVDVGDTDC